MAIGSRINRWSHDVFARIGRERVLDSAASAAFWLFLSLLPIAAVTIMIVTKLAKADPSLLDAMLASVPGRSRVFVGHELGRVSAWHGGTVAPLSAAVFLWLASTGVHAILDAFDATVEAHRPWWKKRLLSIAILVGLSIVVGVVSLVVGSIGHDFVYVLTRTPARYVVAIAAEFAFILGLFWVGVPNSPRCTRRRLPGAILAAALQTVLGWGYVLYLHTLGAGTAYSGATLATIGATMTMIYLITLSLLVGVTLNAVLSTRKVDKEEEERVAADASREREDQLSPVITVQPAHESS